MHMDKDLTYSGKVIKYRNKNYTIRPEESLRGCQGCAFIDVLGCGKELTKHCTKGFIFKRSMF